MTFYSDGTCIGVMDMEDAYRIKDGKIFTYYSNTDEPMYIYSLLLKQDNSLTVRVNGTLDESNISVTIQLKTQKNNAQDSLIWGKICNFAKNRCI